MKHLLTLTLLCFGLLAQAQIPSYVPTNGLVGWWPFNGNANDESGNGNHGTVNGATLAADRFGNAGKAYEFGNNSISNIEILNNQTLKPRNTLTISIWVYLTSNANHTHMIELRINNNNFPYHSYACGKKSTQGPGKFSTILSFTNGDSMELYSKDNIELNNWSNYTFTYDGLNGKMYKNGILEYSQNEVGDILYFQNQFSLFFGGMYGGALSMQGLLDDIAIYNRALSASEVQQLYLGTSAPTTGVGPSQQFHYQAVVNNVQNRPLKNQTLQVRFTIADSLQSYFSETQTITTDDRGHFATQVGTGTVLSGSMNQLPWWSAIPKSLETEIDTNGSGQWVSLGKQPLNAVPLAQYALRTGDGSYSLFGSFDTQGNIQSGNGFTVVSLGNNQYEIRFSSAFTDPPVVQVELVGSGTFQHQTISASTQKVVVQITGNPDRIQFQAKGK